MSASLPDRERRKMGRIIRHAAQNRTLVVDLKAIFGPPPSADVPTRFEVLEEGLRQFMKDEPDFAADCETLLRLHAERKGN